MGVELYRAMGLVHAVVSGWMQEGLASYRSQDRGQGTVEYIGLVLLLAAVMAVVATKGHGAQIGSKVVSAVREAIENVGGSK